MKVHLRTDTNGARCQRGIVPTHLQAVITLSPNPDKVTCQPCIMLNDADTHKDVMAE